MAAFSLSEIVLYVRMVLVDTQSIWPDTALNLEKADG